MSQQHLLQHQQAKLQQVGAFCVSVFECSVYCRFVTALVKRLCGRWPSKSENVMGGGRINFNSCSSNNNSSFITRFVSLFIRYVPGTSIANLQYQLPAGFPVFPSLLISAWSALPVHFCLLCNSFQVVHPVLF